MVTFAREPGAGAAQIKIEEFGWREGKPAATIAEYCSFPAR